MSRVKKKSLQQWSHEMMEHYFQSDI